MIPPPHSVKFGSEREACEALGVAEMTDNLNLSTASLEPALATVSLPSSLSVAKTAP